MVFIGTDGNSICNLMVGGAPARQVLSCRHASQFCREAFETALCLHLRRPTTLGQGHAAARAELELAQRLGKNQRAGCTRSGWTLRWTSMRPWPLFLLAPSWLGSGRSSRGGRCGREARQRLYAELRKRYVTSCRMDGWELLCSFREKQTGSYIRLHRMNPPLPGKSGRR